MSRIESMRLGIVVERRRIAHPWQAVAWVPVEVQAVAADEAPPAEAGAWRLLEETAEGARYRAGSLRLELFPGETEAYRINLTSARPVVYVILRRREETDAIGAGPGPEYEPFLVTVSAEEVQDYLDAGEDVIEGVPMPPPVRGWVEAYVARYHQERPFEKRQRKRWTREPGGAPPDHYGRLNPHKGDDEP